MSYAAKTTNKEKIGKNVKNLVNKYSNIPVSKAVQEFSSFVFLVSMKYLKDEEKSKHTTVSIFKKFKDRFHLIESDQIKDWLYTETKAFCLNNHNK